MTKEKSCCNVPNKKTSWDLILDFAGIAGALLLALAFLPPLIQLQSAHEERTLASDYLRFFAMLILAFSNTAQFILTIQSQRPGIKCARDALGVVTPILVGGSAGTATALKLPPQPFSWATKVAIATPTSFLVMGIFKLVLVSCKVKHHSSWNIGVLLLALLGITGIGICSFVGDETELEHVQQSLSASFDVKVKLVLAMAATGYLAVKPAVKLIPWVKKAAAKLGHCCQNLWESEQQHTQAKLLVEPTSSLTCV